MNEAMTRFLLEAAAPVVSSTIASMITKENLGKLEEDLAEGIGYLTGKIPGEFDDMIVADIEEALKDPALIGRYADMVIDPLKAIITDSENKVDDLLLPALEKLEEVLATQPEAAGAA